MTQTITHLTFAGFGEAATAFLDGWGTDRPAHIAAFDVRSDVAMLSRYRHHGVTGSADASAAFSQAQAVFSVVTADQALAVATIAAPHLISGTLWLDCNSCSPDTKRRAADVITAAGGHYIDVAVMAPVHPKKHHAPLLVAGPDAAVAMALLTALDMRPTLVGDELGQASAIKMIRSVMVKGMEALSAECFVAARRAGVADAVLASLVASDPALDWPRRGAYNLERMMVHGPRRAAEMREVIVTLTDLGLDAGMSAAAAAWQDRVGALQADPGEEDLFTRAGLIADHL